MSHRKMHVGSGALGTSWGPETLFASPEPPTSSPPAILLPDLILSHRPGCQQEWGWGGRGWGSGWRSSLEYSVTWPSNSLTERKARCKITRGSGHPNLPALHPSQQAELRAQRGEQEGPGAVPGQILMQTHRQLQNGCSDRKCWNGALSRDCERVSPAADTVLWIRD